MRMFGKKTVSAARETTLIAPDTVLRGSLRFRGRVYVSGLVEGDIANEGEGEGALVVSVGGRVVGDVNVPVATVAGTVEGNIDTSERLEVAESGVVRGNVRYERIEMQLGATVVGELSSRADDEDGKVHQLPPRGTEKDAGAS